MHTPKRVIMAVHSDYVHDHRVRREAKALTDTGIALEVIAAAPQISEASDQSLDGAVIHRIPLLQQSGKARYLAFIRAVKSRLNQLQPAALYHAHDLDGLMAVAAFAKRRNKMLIYDSHELHTEVHSLQGRPFTRWVWKQIERRYIRKADRIITVSDGIADVLQQRYQLRAKPDVVRNFTDRLRFKDTEPTTRESLHLPQTKHIALYQGVVQHGRGIPAMLEAIAQTTDWGFVICGDGAQKPAMESLAAELGIGDRVRFTGMVSRDHIGKISRHCHAAFLLTEPVGLSHFYSLPNKLTEYIHYGLPVVATGLPEIRNIVESYGTGKIISADRFEAAEISEALHEIGAAPNQFQHGLQKASETLNWQTEKERLLAIYRELL
ncbi:Glycosyltransferase involved in cell wall bisynthesis [Cyclonatronum proteinivorum]|uniref:Glycosyltransferase involved in cell wall bisynthesis n=1 Tax=Cyclonatronum proteinivorum TaxID=1457365 RepID=A0A345UKK1_9BACT|nr:glycosyltransferase family 4 protein [Cyclonatronum proteinivorum]AXJ01003.1 Glycosyltransferase involved in cell wall bisynthesis [Cyclonatronum proteinivorum]